MLLKTRSLFRCRVYYDAAERPEEVWAETSDGACRWRQTGSEVKIIALKVRRQRLAFALAGCGISSCSHEQPRVAGNYCEMSMPQL